MRERFRLLPTSPRFTEEQFLAYVDGQLSPRDRAEIESALANDPQEAERAATYQWQNRLLHCALSSRHLPPPSPAIVQLTEAISEARTPKARQTGILQVAGLLIAALVGALGSQVWEDRAQVMNLALLQDRAPLHLLSAFEPWNEGPAQPLNLRAEDLPSIAPLSTVDPIPDSSGRAPDLRSQGLELIAARLLPGREAGAMELVYETEQRARVSLFFSPARERGNPRFSLLQEGAVTLLFWHQQGRSFGLVSELGRDKLLAIGSAVQAAWRHQPAPTAGHLGPKESSESLL